MRSNGAKTRISPGPLGSGSSRPSRKITPRSYSRRILIELSSQIPTISTKINIIGLRSFIVASSLIGFPLVPPSASTRRSPSPSRVAPASTGRTATASQYSPWTKTLPSGARFVIAVPTWPIMPSTPVSTLLRRARAAMVSRNTVIAENGSATADRRAPVNAQFRHRAIDQHHRAQHHGHRAARAQNAVRSELHLQQRRA